MGKEPAPFQTRVKRIPAGEEDVLGPMVGMSWGTRDGRHERQRGPNREQEGGVRGEQACEAWNGTVVLSPTQWGLREEG